MSFNINIHHLLTLFNSNNSGFISIGLNHETIEISSIFAHTIGLSKCRFTQRADFCKNIDTDDVEPLNNQISRFNNGECTATEMYLRFLVPNSFPVWTRLFLYSMDIGNGLTSAVGHIFDTTGDVANRLLVHTCLDGTYFIDVANNISAFTGEPFETVESSAELSDKLQKRSYKFFQNKTIDESIKPFFNHFNALVSHQTKAGCNEFLVQEPGKEPIWISNHGKIYYDNNGAPYLYVGGYINIDYGSTYKNHVAKEAQVNNITKYPNKNRCIEDIDELLFDSGAAGYMFMVLVNNFSDFKNTSDYAISNRFLETIIHDINDTLFSNSKLYHYEGNCFIILTKNISSNTALEQVQALLALENKPFIFNNEVYPYHISLSATAFPEHGKSGMELIHNGEIAMQCVLSSPNTRYTFFNNNIFENFQMNIKLDSDIRNCVYNKMEGFFLEYQPFVDCFTHEYIGAEALVRWRNHYGYVMYPAEFLPAFERLNLMDSLGSWVLEQTIQQCAKWTRNRFDSDFFISANVTPSQLIKPGFSSKIMQMIKSNNIQPKNLMLEITEDTLIKDFNAGIEQIRILRDYGVQFAIDDFGTGYSSLEYLLNLPVDVIKIDKAFIQNIYQNDTAKKIIGTLITLIDCVEKKIIVEGVETKEQLSVLKQMNIDYFQGFYFGRSLSKGAFEKKYLSEPEIQNFA